MAHSQRQKKRSSQFKKKHFDAKGRAQSEGGGGGGKKESPQNKTSQQGQTGGVGREGKVVASGESVEEKDNHHLQGDDRSEDVRRYSRRKLASNWGRFDRDEEEEVAKFSPETEEQLQQRLVQLLDLPLAPQTAHWEPGEDTQLERQGGEGFLSLNVAELAESLKELPVHTRLDLSPQLLDSYGVMEGDLETGGGASDQQAPPPHYHVPEEPDLKALLTRAKDTTTQLFHFRALPESTTVQSQQPPLGTGGEGSGAAESDADLENLLLSSSRDKPHPPPPLHSPPSGPLIPAPSSTAHTLSHGTSPPTSSSTPLPPLSSRGESSLPSTDELDDILDDLLL